jgi:hypothetical protein
MPIFEATAASLAAIPATNFAALGLKERADLQRLLAARIEALEEGLLVLAEEFGDWADSARRIDLLCLDTDANLVVVELKRDEDGGHMDLQALRYAAMVSVMTFDQAAATLARHRNKAAPDESAARAAILAHLGWSEPDEEAFAQETRMALAAADFGKEITTTVLWLRDRHGVDIRCVRLRPHRMSDGRLLLDIQTLIPLPEVEAFQTQIGAKQAAERKERAERHDLRYRFWSALLTEAKTKTAIHANRSPSDDGWLSGSTGRAGFDFTYTTRQKDSQVEVWIVRNKAAFQQLLLQKDAIEQEFKGTLDWQELPAKEGSRIRFVVEGGYRSPPDEWPEIHTKLIDAMIRLDKAFRARIAKLP